MIRSESTTIRKIANPLCVDSAMTYTKENCEVAVEIPVWVDSVVGTCYSWFCNFERDNRQKSKMARKGWSASANWSCHKVTSWCFFHNSRGSYTVLNAGVKRLQSCKHQSSEGILLHCSYSDRIVWCRPTCLSPCDWVLRKQDTWQKDWIWYEFTAELHRWMHRS